LSLATLRSVPEAEQQARGYHRTLQDISRQPSAWLETLTRLAPAIDRVIARTPPSGARHGGAVLLTGSGSSHFVGDSCRLSLQNALGIPVHSIAGGTLLTGGSTVPAADSLLAVSIARSGDSPESRAVVDLLLTHHPTARHVVLTCCREGRLASAYEHDPRVLTCVLGDHACDRGVVTTGSFTSLLIAARALGFAERWPAYQRRVEYIASRVDHVMAHDSEALARIGSAGFGSAIYLGTGDRAGSAREAALKMLEMTGGHVRPMTETYLGVRHGPVTAIHPDTLVVAFLSRDPIARAYEVDLLEELADKDLGQRTVIVGSDVPSRLVRPGRDEAIDVKDGKMDDGELTLVDAVVGQLLAFFAGVSRGVRVDTPAPERVMTRVVPPFRIHGPAGAGV
jgi:tagatose-6-phosphate ketose/aldose isomerase